MSSPLSDTYPVAGYMSQLSHTSIPPLQQNDDNRLPALRGGTDCLTLTYFRTKFACEDCVIRAARIINGIKIKRPRRFNCLQGSNFLVEISGFEPLTS